MLRDVLRTAIEAEADPQRFPDDWLIPVRSEGKQCPRCGGEVERIVVSGRSGYFCPACQQKK
jgi:formamidopyrimidine-DNA glycosylase